MNTRELIVLLGTEHVGRVTQNKHGRLQFTYAENWLRAENAYPLSFSMPFPALEHGHKRIETFLWGLLPDNETILSDWGRLFQVSARNAFGLIANVGEDCAGAVQFVRPERLEAVQAAKRGDIEWLDEAQVGERLRLLKTDPSSWRMGKDAGQFSLAGAQPKTALLFEKGRWGIPSGRIPTTHILKPPNTHLQGFPENEHFCLELARALGLAAAKSQVMHFDAEPAIVVERYDRAHTPAGWIRIHQEDFCQALGLAPGKKYQNDGGPGPRAICGVLDLHSSARIEDRTSFVDALALNWLIAGTDAHAKNYSLLIAPQGRMRLAPLYDVASVLPYPQFDVNRVQLAMKVGDKYRLSDVGIREWRKLATDLRVDANELIGRIVGMTQAIPDRVEQIAGQMAADGLEHPIVEKLKTRLIGRSRRCLKELK